MGCIRCPLYAFRGLREVLLTLSVGLTIVMLFWQFVHLTHTENESKQSLSRHLVPNSINEVEVSVLPMTTIKRAAMLKLKPGAETQVTRNSSHDDRDISDMCRLYEHLDLPASNSSGPQYTYRYRRGRVIRTPEARHLCDSDTQVFVAIDSAAFYFDRRKAMRDTWVKWFRNDKTLNKIVRIIFLVGVPENITNSSQNYSALLDEIDWFGDILQVDVEDTYKNITWKLLALYNFVLTAPECSVSRAPRLRYLFKPDDDVFVNPTSFMKRLGELDAIREKVTASFFYGFAIQRDGPKRNANSQWYVPKQIWPSDKWGFDYAAGCGFWQTFEALRVVQAAALCLRVLYIDDVYLSGHLRQALGVRLFHTLDVVTGDFVAAKEERTHIACGLNPSAVRAVWALTFARITNISSPSH